MIVGTAGHIDHGKTALVKRAHRRRHRPPARRRRRAASPSTSASPMRRPPTATRAGLRRRAGPRALRAQHAGRRHRHRLRAAGGRGGRRRRCRRRASISRSSTCSASRRGAVALTKIDLVRRRACAEVEAQMAGLLAGTSLAGRAGLPRVLASRVPESTRCARTSMRRPPRPRRVARTGAFGSPWTGRFTLTGTGIVVTGTAHSGAVAVDDQLVVSPGGLEVRVRSIHAQNRRCRARQRGTALRAEPGGSEGRESQHRAAATGW